MDRHRLRVWCTVRNLVPCSQSKDGDQLSFHRHLAQTWSTTYISPHSKRRLLRPSGLTEIDTIEHLILLDLLGAANPKTRSFFLDTAWLYDSMVSAEKRLGDSGAFVYGDQKNAQWNSFFHIRTGFENNLGYIGDDHVPFLHKGVSVLHIIAEPFPRVWHTLDVGAFSIVSLFHLSLFSPINQDDASALDLSTMRRWNLILRVFMSEYLNLQPQHAKRQASTSTSPDESACKVQRSNGELVSIFIKYPSERPRWLMLVPVARPVGLSQSVMVIYSEGYKIRR